MITIEDFRTLPFERQCDYVTVFGDYVAHRGEGSMKFYLYHLEGFYVEISYSSPHKRVIGVYAFKATRDLWSYLKHINIDLSFLAN